MDDNQNNNNPNDNIPISNPNDQSQNSKQTVVDDSSSTQTQTTTPQTPPQQTVATDNPPPVPEPAPQATPPTMTPTGGKQKEFPPFVPQMPVSDHEVHDTTKADEVAKEEGDEYWEKFAREIQLEKEVAEMGGVEKIESGEVPVPKEIAKEMGIKPSVTIDTPIAKIPSDFSVRGITLTDDQLTAGEKKPVKSALRWLAEWFIFQLKKAHFFVKVVKGKVLRQKTETSGADIKKS